MKKTVCVKIEDVKNKAKIAILGGAFNPIHKGHLSMGKACYDFLEPDCLYYVPTYYPPHKHKMSLLPYSLRMDMLIQVLEAESEGRNLKALDIERFLPQPNYTLNLLNQLLASAEKEKQEIFLVIGADSFIEFHNWYNFMEYKDKCQLAVALRPGILPQAVINQKEKLQSYGFQIVFFPLEEQNISSTEIRNELLKLGEKNLAIHLDLPPQNSPNFSQVMQPTAIEKLKKYLPASIYNYCCESCSYYLWEKLKEIFATEIDSENIFQDILVYEKLLLENINFKRAAHSFRVAMLAVFVAWYQQIDLRKILQASLLHDLKKFATFEKDSYLCKEWTINEKDNLNFWHGPLAAAFLQQNNIIKDQEILEAIKVHTTLKKGYDSLAGLLYVVDKVELGRTYSDIKDIRRTLVYNLDRAVYLCLKIIAYHLEKMGLSKEASTSLIIASEAEKRANISEQKINDKK